MNIYFYVLQFMDVASELKNHFKNFCDSSYSDSKMNDHLQQKLKSKLLKANSTNKKLALWFNLTCWWKGIMTSGNTKKKHPLKTPPPFLKTLLDIPNYITYTVFENHSKSLILQKICKFNYDHFRRENSNSWKTKQTADRSE